MHMRDLVGMGHHFLPSEPTKWNVEDVYEFIRSLPGKVLGSSTPAWSSKEREGVRDLTCHHQERLGSSGRDSGSGTGGQR